MNRRVRDPQVETLLACLMTRLAADALLVEAVAAVCEVPHVVALACPWDPGEGQGVAGQGATFPILALYRQRGKWAPQHVERRRCETTLGLTVILPPIKDTGAGMGLLALYAASIDKAAEQMFDDFLCGGALKDAAVEEAFTEWEYEVGVVASPEEQLLFPSLRGTTTMYHGWRFEIPGVSTGTASLWADINLRPDGALSPKIDPVVSVSV